ncbi:MAG: hypothetical protein HND27_09095 [Bacteroidetes bacterium]|nr:hypothetical protein [Flavobacteriales bacterium]MCL4817328.1 hypothetical protein [Flavobacteriales bacterium]NOG95918.1 hypothetical protein [Bacteroidota bacterium]WKZ74169.1 MAG: hypothetical protein QY303_08415 [Vicingaceae bacterium]CAG0974668.1 hypothetical protein FLAV_01429 [Flavobacteriales bacterium]
MSTSAIIMMLLVQGTVTAITGYLFYKVLTTKPKPEPDSYIENDSDPR